jgi:hypothetical protein
MYAVNFIAIYFYITPQNDFCYFMFFLLRTLLFGLKVAPYVGRLGGNNMQGLKSKSYEESGIIAQEGKKDFLFL